MRPKAITLLAALGLWPSISQALVVNLDVNTSDSDTFAGQGAFVDPGHDFWNDSQDGMANMTASDGVTATSIDVTISTGARHDATGGNIPAGQSHSTLVGDYSYSRDSDTTLDISGLTPNGHYELYIYCQGDNLNQAATVTIGGTSVSTTGLIDGTIQEGENFAVIAATADTNGEITGTVSNNGSRYAAVNGLQIVELEGVPTPWVVNVDLGGSSIGEPGDGDNGTGTPFTGQGAYSDPGNDYWTNTLTTSDRTAKNLIASDGTTTTNVEVAVYGGGGFEDTNKTNYLLSDYFYGNITAAVSGLDPGGNYTVYVYACGDKSGQGSDVSINGVTKSTSNSGNPDAYSQGVNYVAFDATADTIGRITIYSDEKLNGFQIIEGSPGTTNYEAEDAVFSGLTIINSATAAGNQCLGDFDTVSDYVEYQNVEAGNTLIIRYANGDGTTQCSVYVNNVDVATAIFNSTDSWSLFTTTTLSDIDIPQGAAIRLQLDADDITANNGSPCALQDNIDIDSAGELIIIDSILELLEVLPKSNVDVKMTPGVYDLDESDKDSGLLPIPTFFEFKGSNCTYDFTDVTINVHTNMFDEYGAVEVLICTVTGNNNHIFGLIQKDIGDELLSKNVLNFRVIGDDNKIEEISLYPRSSYPYGYGDLFGKGSDYVIGHRKHSGLLVNGQRNHLLNCFLDMKVYGHGIFLQGAIDTLVEGCHLIGEINTTDNVLAEEGTGSPADQVDFMTVWGWPVPPGFAFSCQEDGIRAYNKGTLPDGTERDTANTTVRNCTIENMRSGVTIGFSNNTNSITGCTVIGTEGAFWPGDGNSVLHCQGEASYATIINNPYQGDDNQTYSVTVLRETEVYGAEQLIYLGGHSHDVTLLNSGIQPRPSSQTSQVGGLKLGMRYMEVVEGRNDYTLSNSVINNWTDQTVTLDPKSSNCDVFSYGTVTDSGSGNSSSPISPVTVTSSASNGTEINTIDANPATSWTASGIGEWIQYDLGQSRNLYSVSIQWLNGAARQQYFDIQTSNTGTDGWTTVYSGVSTGASSDFEEYAFRTQNARHIRVTGLGNSVNDSIGIVEMEVDLKDRFAMVKAKSDNGTGFVAQNTLDGDLDTRWSAEGDGQWIQYDLLNPKTINSASLAWHLGDTRTSSFDLMVANHPMGPWTSVYSGASSGTTADLEKYAFPPVTARFLRVTGQGNSEDDWNELTEIFIDTSSAGESSSETGLLAHWALDDGEGTTATDVSGNGRDGTITAPQWSYAQDGEPALYFDGSSSTIDIPASAFDAITTQVSLSLWAYGGVTQPVDNCVLRAQTSSGARTLNIHLPWGDGTVYWDAGNNNGYDRISKVATGTEISGAWNHWVFTKDATAGTMNIYLNGEPWHSETSGNHRSMIGTTVAKIGSDVGDLYYEGTLDDVRLYNTALSASEISDSYEQQMFYRDWVEIWGLENADAASASDPDSDTMPNLLEYALGGNPNASDLPAIQPTSALSADGSSMEFSFRRRIDAADRGLDYAAKTTDDLSDPYSWTTDGITEIDVSPIDSEFEMVTVSLTMGDFGFLRLEVTMDPN